MNADNDYKIGNSHIVCEDYALSGVDGDSAFAIVSDGCSASGDVDFGSRILAMSARELLAKIRSYNPEDNFVGYAEFGSQVIQRANTIPPLFPSLHPGVLDATLLVASVQGNNLKAYIYGDGVFLHKTTAGLHSVSVSFDNNAPSYLSYELDGNRKEGYLSLGGTKNVEVKFPGDTKSKVLGYSPFAPLVINSTVQPGDVIAVCSDGIHSFKDAESKSIDWTDLIEDFIGYKNFDAAFVKRRMAAFKRKCIKEGITHYDDISIATIVI